MQADGKMIAPFLKFLSLPLNEKIRFFGFFLFNFYHAAIYGLLNLYNITRFKCYGVSYGKRFSSAGTIILDIYPGSQVLLGDNVSIISDSRRCTAAALSHPSRFKTFTPSSKIIIGSNVGLNGTSITSRSKTITIGDDSMIAPNVIIVDSDFHSPWPPEMRREYLDIDSDGEIIIGKKCWIGMNSIILKGVTIGDNSIIAAGSVVIHNIPPDSLAAGIPAKVVKKYDKGDQVT
jgi:acetyltransferase-like isoleucine patch superfamily enzyme